MRVPRPTRVLARVLVVAALVGSVTFAIRGRSTAAATLPIASLPTTLVNQVEGNSGTATVTLSASLSQPSSSTVSVNYATVDNTAKVGDADYVGSSGTLTFSPGQVSQTLSVQVVGDAKLEDYQIFRVTLSSPTNATLGNASERIQILNDEKPKLAIAKVAAVSEGQPAVFKPHLVQRYYQPMTLNAQTLDGTAKAPGDYSSVNRSINVAAGSKAPILTSVPTIADGTSEISETFSLAVTGSSVVSGVTRSATIAGQTCTAGTAPSTYQHVVIVVMENKSYGDVIGNAAAPFLTSIARSCATATHYAQAASPSRPNYIAMTAGNTYGCEGSNADPPGGCAPPSPSVFKQVLDSGRTVRSYAEGMSTNCELVSHGVYAVKHNPWPYYAAEASLCQQFDQPMPPTLDVDNLPTLTYISPDLCNDTHDCSVAIGDQWLQAHVQPILDSAAYLSGSTAVIVTYDEYTNLPNVFASRSVRPGTVVAANTSHYGFLRTVEDMLGLAPLGQAATATSLRTATNL